MGSTLCVCVRERERLSVCVMAGLRCGHGKVKFIVWVIKASLLTAIISCTHWSNVQSYRFHGGFLWVKSGENLTD